MQETVVQENAAQATAVPRRAKLPEMSRNAWLLLTISAGNALALVSVGALVNPYLRDLGMSPAFVGLYFSVSAGVQGIASFVGGFLADAVGRRRIWLTGKLLQITAYVLLAAGLRGPAVLVAAALTGFSQIAVGAATALQAEASKASWRATYFAAVQTASSLIGAVAPLAGGLVADRFGARWAFVAILPLLLVVARMITMLEERPPPGRAATERLPSGNASPRPARLAARLARRMATARAHLGGLSEGILRGPYPRTAFSLLAYNVLNGTANGVISIALPLLFRDRFGMGYTGISGIQTAVGLGMALTMIVGARIADRRGRRKVILFALFSGAVLCYALPFLTSVGQYYVIIFGIGLVANSANGAFMATSVDSVRPDSRATFGGVTQGLFAGGMSLGSLVGGVAYAVTDLLPLILAAGAFTAGALLMFFFLQETRVVEPA